MTKSQQLASQYGGQWTYDGVAHWHCDDKRRHVSRCSQMFDDEGTYGSEYWLYEKDKSPVRVNFYLTDLM